MGCVLTSGPASWKEELGLVSVSPSASVALVSTLATVSVHIVLKCLSHCPCGYTDGTTEWKHSHPQMNTCLQSLQQLPLGLRCPNWMWPCTCCFLPQLGLPVHSRGGRPRSLGESPIGRLVLAVETACTCWTQLHDGSLCCLSVHCV